MVHVIGVYDGHVRSGDSWQSLRRQRVLLVGAKLTLPRLSSAVGIAYPPCVSSRPVGLSLLERKQWWRELESRHESQIPPSPSVGSPSRSICCSLAVRSAFLRGKEREKDV